jgi:hypothetical protein
MSYNAKEREDREERALMKTKQKDKCLHCSKIMDAQLFGASCNCKKPKVVHLQNCDTCPNVLGIMVEDDYVGGRVWCERCVNE